MKTAAKIAGGVILLAVLGWTGTFLYWHVTLTSAINTFERGPRTDGFDAANNTLIAAGCRSLPHLIRSIDRSGGDFWHYELLYVLAVTSAADGNIPLQSEPYRYFEACIVDPEPTRAKYVAWRAYTLAWWSKSGSAHHQGWRVWSSSCRLSRKRLFGN